jgi:hypothetical protein
MATHAKAFGSPCRVAAEMLERRFELHRGSILALDPQRRLGHDALEVPEIGVVPQRFKYPSRAAVANVTRGREYPA